MAANEEVKSFNCGQWLTDSRRRTCFLLICLVVVAVTITVYGDITGGITFVTDNIKSKTRSQPNIAPKKQILNHEVLHMVSDVSTNQQRSSGTISQKSETVSVVKQKLKKSKTRSTPNITPKKQILNPTLSGLLDIQKQYIRNTAVFMHKAHLHARGVKTNDALRLAIENYSKFLRTVNLSFPALTERKVVQSQHICPEKITSATTGYPLYDIGYIVQNCSYAVPLENIVTILLLHHSSSTAELERTLKGVFTYLPNISVIVGFTKQPVDQKQFAKKFPTVTTVKNDITVSDGKLWNSLANKVKTKYALIARDVISFNSDARIDRMVREIEMLKVTVVGGSTRHIDNKWKIGCHQRAFRNYTVSFIEGYDESIHDCLFCDHVDGPFLIRQVDVKKTRFDEQLPEMGLFEDFFMRLKGESILCPDAMYYTNIEERSREKSRWKAFGKKRTLYELKYSDKTINFGCEYGKYPCGKAGGKMLFPCCMLEISNLITYIGAVCREGNVICQVNAGTILGSIKFYNIIPWERDGDYELYDGNFTAFGKLGHKFTSKGYIFEKHIGNTIPCSDEKRGIYQIYSKYWRVDFPAKCITSASKQRNEGFNNTLIPIAGKHVVGPRNPALYGRNMYPYFFQHSEHNHVIGQKSYTIYKKHFWTKCRSPGSHDCLNNYRVDGNIQFMNVIP